MTTGLPTSWNPNPSSSVTAVAVTSTAAYIGGYFTYVGGTARNQAAAVNLTTGALLSWDPSPNSSVNAIVISGNIVYMGGEFSSLGGQARNCIGAVDITTGLATSWNANLIGSSRHVYSINILGNLAYVGGYFSQIGGTSRSGLAAIDLTTGLANSWNPNIPFEVYCVCIAGNNLYAGGDFTWVNGISKARNSVASFLLPSATPTSWDPNLLYFDGGNACRPLAINVVGNTVYIGGEFSSVSGEIWSGLVGLEDNSIVSGINNSHLISLNEISVFPVPAKDELKVIVNESATPYSLKILNANGQAIYRQDQLETGITNTISLKSLPRGLFILEIMNDRGVGYKKIIIE